METNQPTSNSEQSVTPQKLAKDVFTLLLEGKGAEAAQLLIEEQRQQLPDGHPSKEPQTSGTIEGDQVWQLAQFEALETAIVEGLDFATVLTRVRKDPDFLANNVAAYFYFERKHDMAHFTKYLANNEGDKAFARQHATLQNLKNEANPRTEAND